MYSILLCRATSVLHIIPAYRKHPHRDYTYNRVHTVYTATQLKTSMYCNCDRGHSSQRFIDCTLSSTITITYVHILIYWLYWVWYLNDFCNFSKVEDIVDASKHVRIRGQAIKKPNFFFLIYCFTYNLIILVTFKVLPSTLDTPLPTFFFFHFWNASWNVFCGTARRSSIEFSPISSTVWNRRPFSEDFRFGSKKSPQGPNLESREAGSQQSSHASSKIHG